MPKKIWFGAAWCWTILTVCLCLVSFRELPSVRITGADKYVHFTIHFVFTVLWFLYFKWKKEGANLVKIALGILFLSLVFGIAIEVAQETLTSTRKADIYDVAANFSGALTAVIVLLVANRLLKKQQSSELHRK